MMKKIIISVMLILSLIATSSVAFAGSSASQSPQVRAMDALVRIDLVLESKSYDGSTAGSMPWGSSLTFQANIYWDDGWREVDNFAVVDWTLTDSSGGDMQVWTKKWRGSDGIERIKIFAPYGKTGNLVLKAVSRIENTLSATQNISVTDGTKTTGARFFRSVFGAEIPEIELWDKEKGTYTAKLLPIPDTVQYIKGVKIDTFRWMLFHNDTDEGKAYKPNETVSFSIEQSELCYIGMQVGRKKPPISTIYYKSIRGLYTRPYSINTEVTWNAVESAKGYYIYKYNKTKQKYVKVATVKGRDRTSWYDKKVESGNIYKYKVQPYKIASGKKRKMKQSESVSTLFDYPGYSNALEVQLSPAKTVKKKAGKTASFKATVVGIEGKKLIDKKVRWYSSNKKIATVSKNGKVKFIKKGKCYIYAKAHNGIDSKKIKIEVI